MNKDNKNVKVRHASLDMPDVDVVKKKYDVITKARNKLFHFGDGKSKDVPGKIGKQSAIECLFKATHKPLEGIIENLSTQPSRLKKQNSVSGYPIQIQVEEYDDCTISRGRPATICVDKIDRSLDTAALALERPRKKLSFKEPEVMSFGMKGGVRGRKGDANTLSLPTGGMKRSCSFTNGMIRTKNDDDELESQAMRVVRTVGQAFEVCHKLSITAPENDNLDQEEQETLTQDLLSDRLSDVASDKCRKDLHLETDLDRISLPGCEDYCLKDPPEGKTSRQTMPRQLDLLPPPPSSNNKPSSLISAETYSSPQSDALTAKNSSTSIPLPPPGSALSAHHEIQLLREQLEQQSQQTQAAMAQLQLAREQLASEQAARMEAQSRTHQLLVHNRELLDHIASLVSHLQSGSDKSGVLGGHQQNSTHVTLPQHQASGVSETYMPDLSEASLDNSLHQALGMTAPGLIENRAVAAQLPPSPLTAFSPTGTMFNFPYAQEVPTFENQLLHRLSGYSTAYPFTYNPTLPYLPPASFYPASNVLNNNYTLPPPPRKYSTAPMPIRSQNQGVRHNSEPRQFPYSVQMPSYPQSNPATSTATSRPSSLIKPLSQVGTLTTTDSEGKVRMIVPVTSDNSINNNDPEGLLANLKLTDDFRMSGPPIQRTTSEKVPNRSELMSQLQRAMWARHTTK